MFEGIKHMKAVKKSSGLEKYRLTIGGEGLTYYNRFDFFHNCESVYVRLVDMFYGEIYDKMPEEQNEIADYITGKNLYRTIADRFFGTSLGIILSQISFSGDCKIEIKKLRQAIEDNSEIKVEVDEVINATKSTIALIGPKLPKDSELDTNLDTLCKMLTGRTNNTLTFIFSTCLVTSAKLYKTMPDFMREDIKKRFIEAGVIH